MTTHLVKQNLKAKISQSTAVFSNSATPLDLSSCQKIRERRGKAYIYWLASLSNLYRDLYSTSTFQIYEVMLLLKVQELIFYICLLAGNYAENLYFDCMNIQDT